MLDLTQLQNFMQDLKFPITKGELIANAQQSGQDEDLITNIKSLHKDTFHNQNELLSGFKKLISFP